MIRQTILPFKLEITKDTITSHAGLALLGEFCVGIGLLDKVNHYLPSPGSGVGFKASAYVFPLVLMFNGGGRSLEDLRVIRDDVGLREILPLSIVPSADAVGDWLRRAGVNGGLAGLEQANRSLLKRALKHDGRKRYTLDIDATGIFAEKQLAQMTYKGFKGYMPIVGHLAENGLVVGEQFRDGNVSPGAGNLEFIKHCIKQMPKGKRIGRLRADNASYQAKVFNFCEKHGIEFAIGAALDEAVVRGIESLPESAWREYKGGHIGEFVHCMNETNKAFRILVVRRPYQGQLFAAGSAAGRYFVMATNMEGAAEEVLSWYHQRGEHSENRIKDLKIGFGMERMPCGQTFANAVFFRIGALAYNLYRLFLTVALEPSWHKHQVQTVRWRLYQTAGKIVDHSNRVFLKVRRSYYQLFSQIRLRTWRFVTT